MPGLHQFAWEPEPIKETMENFVMTADQFAYWLQGFAELNGAPPSAEQWQAIRDHLGLVFNKVTPPLRVPTSWPTTGPFAPMPYKADLPFAHEFMRSECSSSAGGILTC